MSYEHKEPMVQHDIAMNQQQPPQYAGAIATPPPQATQYDYSHQQPQMTQPQPYIAQPDQAYYQGQPQHMPVEHQPQPQHTQSYHSQPGVQQQQQQQQQQQTGMPAGQQFQNVVALSNLTSTAAPVRCPACGQQAMTRATFKSGNTTNAWALGLFLTTCCCCIAYMINGTKDVVHNCGNCGVQLATWHRSGRTEINMHS